jgi:hypothetical protein
MPQKTNLNVSPYYDDYDSSKNFYKVLFRPGYSIQTRELTSLQSILQNQIESYGRYQFKQGDLVVPGEVGLNNRLNYVKLSSVSEVAVNVDNEIVYQKYDIKKLVGQQLQGITSGVVATVLAADYATETEADTLYVKYTTSGDSSEEFTFRQGETLEVVNGVNTPLLVVGTDGNVLPTNIVVSDPDTKELSSLFSPAMGYSSAVKVEEGIYFVNGYFVQNAQQLLIVNKYYDKPSAKVGFFINEQIITPEQDSTLYDNSRGSSNFASPGAHRLKITLDLIKYEYDEPTDKNFIELIRVKSGVVQQKVKETEYNLLEETLARRTYDESGDYVVDNFPLEIREYYQKDNNLGLYSADSSGLVNGISIADASSKMVASVAPGKAYVRGFEIVNKETKYLDINKSRDTITRSNVTIKSSGLSEFKITNVYGSVPLNAEGADLTSYPTVYLNCVFNDGTYGLNGIDNEANTFKTIDKRGVNFSFVDTEVGALDRTDIGIKTIYIDVRTTTSFATLDNLSELWFVKTRSDEGTVSTVGYGKVLSYSVVKRPDIDTNPDKNYVELTVYGRKDLLDIYLKEYDDDEADGARKVFISKENARNSAGNPTLVYGTIVDYNQIITPIVGITKANDFRLAEFGQGFNKDRDKVSSKGSLADGSPVYNSIFSINYFDPIYFTKLTLDSNIVSGFNAGKYFKGSASGAYGVVEGKDAGFYSTGNILFTKTLFGSFIPGETIIDEDGNSLRIARENTVSHFVVKKQGFGYGEDSKVKLDGIEYNPSQISVKVAGTSLYRIQILDRDSVNTVYSHPPIVEVQKAGEAGSNAIVEAVLFKNTVFTYSSQNIKSLDASYGSGNSSNFTADVEISKDTYIETTQVTEFTFSGAKGAKFIECNGFVSDASKLLVQGDFIQFADVDGDVVRGIVQYATTPQGTKKSRIYLNSALTNDVSNATIVRSRPLIDNASTSSLLFPTGGKEVSSIVRDITDSKIKYYFRRDFVVTGSNSGGGITFSAQLPFGTQRFTAFTENNYVITVLDPGDSTTVAKGDIVYVNKSFVSFTSATEDSSGLTSGSITINFPSNYFGQIDTNFPKLKLSATLEVNKAKPKLKTAIRNKRIIIKSNRDLVIPLRGQDYDTNEVEVNSYSDVYRLRYVYEGTVASPPSVDSNGVLIRGTDVTNKFTFDNGQRDTLYDVARLVLKPGFEAPVGQLVVAFDYFEHSQGDFCTVDSYLHEAGVTPDEVPSFNSSVYGIVSLKDVFDFRPKVDSTVIVSGFQDKSYISQPNYINFNGPGGTVSNAPSSDDNLEYTISFNETRYLDRIDGIFLDKKGNFIVKEGNASLNPTKPEAVNDAIPLYYLYVPSYTRTAKDVRIIPVDNKRYTMRDIGKLEKRVERLEYYTTLSILEQQALNMQIKDDIGLDRFKSGFIVDNFESHRVGNLKSLDYKCSIDTQQSVLRPQVKEDSITLEEVNKREDQRIIAGYQKTGNIITLPYKNISLLGNSFATKTINPNPFVVIQYVGDVNISPTVDQWYDTTVTPLITENNTNLYSVFLAKDEVQEGFSSLYNSFITNWIGVDKVFFNINSFADSNTEQANTTVRQANIASSSNVSPQNNEIAKGVNSSSIKELSVASSIKYFARSIPVKFSVRRMKPKTAIHVFLDGRKIDRWAVPDIRFTGIPGNSPSSFNSPIITDGNGNASGIILIPAGRPPRENTAWTGDVNTVSYDIAAEELRFTTGNKVIRFTTSPTNEDKEVVDSYAEINFYASGIVPENPGSIVSTKPAYFKSNEGVQQVNSNTDIKEKPNPLAQTFKIENFDGGVFVTGVDLFFNKKSQSIPVKVYLTNTDTGKPGKYIVPGSESIVTPETYLRVFASGNLQIKKGENITGKRSNASGPLEKVLDKNNIEVLPTTAGEFLLDNEQVYTLVLNNHNGTSFLQNEPLEIASLTEFNNTQGTNLILTIAKDSGKVVNLKIENVGSNYESAVIIIESPQLPGGSNCTGSVNVSDGIIYNAELVLSGSGYTEAPSVVIRGTGTGASGAVIRSEIEIDTLAVRMGVAVDEQGRTLSVTPTRFNFEHPVYLQNNTEYALAIETDSIDYEMWASRLGETEIVTNVNVTSQPLLGAVYKSQNTDNWVEDIFEDIKFTLYRAEFDISRSAEVLLTNKPLGYEKVKKDPFETYALANSNATSDLFKNNNSIVKVTQRDHGFEVSGKSYVFFKQAQDVGGISGLSLNTALYKVTNSGLDTYNIVAANRAGSSVFGGGENVLATYNRKFERLYAQISYLQLPNTVIDCSVKTTNIIPVDSSTQNYRSYTQSEFEKTFLNQEHFFTNQKVISSSINEVLNNIDNSLVYKVNLSSTVSYLSPVIDLNTASVKTSTNRVENSTGYENRFGKRYQVLKFLPVYRFDVTGSNIIAPNQNVVGRTTGAAGEILKVQNNTIWVKVTSFNTFEAGEPLTFSNQNINTTVSSFGPTEIKFNFPLGSTAVAFNPLNTTRKYDNKISGKVILWDPKTKELTLEVDKFPIEGDYTSPITLGSVFSRKDNEVLQAADIFRVGDILYYQGISPGNESFAQVSEMFFTTGIDYAFENGSKNSSSVAKYVTKEVVLSSPGTSLDARLTLNIKNVDNVKVLYKIKDSSSEVNFDDLNWQYFNTDGNPDGKVLANQSNVISGQFEKQESYQEFKYSVSNLPEFTSFAVKIVMKTDDPVYVPKIQDLRVVASY